LHVFWRLGDYFNAVDYGLWGRETDAPRQCENVSGREIYGELRVAGRRVILKRVVKVKDVSVLIRFSCMTRESNGEFYINMQ
jgi:hypothetical protein